MSNWRAAHFNQHRELFRDSRAVIKRGSSSFYFAFSKLPDYQAYSVFAIYHLLRLLDDSVDEHDDAGYAKLTAEWAAFKQGETPASGPWPALRVVCELFTINYQWLDDMWAGQSSDRHFEQPATNADLRHYCYQVAGTVGLLLMPILTDDAVTTALPAVIAIGVAMQLTNILRDVSEDAANQRCYLPRDRCEHYGVTVATLRAGQLTDGLRQLLAEQAQLAETAYASLPDVLTLVPSHQSQQILQLASDVYHGILTKIVASDYAIFSHRFHLTAGDKLRLFKSQLNRS